LITWNGAEKRGGGPTKCSGNDSNLALGSGWFSNGVVDGHLLQVGPHLIENGLSFGRVLPSLGNSGQAGVQLGLVLLDEFHQRRGLGDEHTGVPAVVTRREVLGSRVGIGLLLERAHETGSGRARNMQLVAELDITETSRRVRGSDTNGDEEALFGDLDGLGDGVEEGILSSNHMISGKGSNDGVGIAVQENGGGETNGGHGILGAGLSEQVGTLELRQLLHDGF